MKHTRSALALSSVALTISVLVTGMPHASADPYEEDDSGEVVSSDPGHYETPPDDAGDQNDIAGPDVADSGDWYLLDNETPAWGIGATASGGARLFEITKAQQLPGLSVPGEAPVPGYDGQLASSDEEAPRTATETLVTLAVGSGVLALASLAFFVIKGRGRRTDDD